MSECISSTAYNQREIFKLPRCFIRGPMKFEIKEDCAYCHGVILQISTAQQNALFLLSREEQYITFEQLYTKIFAFEYDSDYEPDEEQERPPDRNQALSSMEQLMVLIDSMGKGEIWIEFETDKGYIMRMANLSKNNEIISGRKPK